VIPVAAGIGGTDYQDPELFAPGFSTAAYLMAGLWSRGSAGRVTARTETVPLVS
jgi:hypothetical protein